MSLLLLGGGRGGRPGRGAELDNVLGQVNEGVLQRRLLGGELEHGDPGGGGDRDEAVLEGLIAALQQRWSKDARRVIVLVGDAPPHDATEASIQSRMKAFAADGRSYMHAIVTSENGKNQLPKDTLKSFGKIASAGKGQCLPFEDEEQILRHALRTAPALQQEAQ